MNRTFLASILISVLIIGVPHAQEEKSSGKVMKVSKKTVSAEFEDADISVGDEIEIQRTHEIIDPVSGKLRGERIISIAKGVIDGFGLGKASIKIIEDSKSKKVEIGDIVVLSGGKKQIINSKEPVENKIIEVETKEPPPLKYGDIQDINDDIIVTNLGAEDDINEGDSFLIQRTEPEYNPTTNEIIGVTEVNVGKLVVDSVSDSSSVTRIIEKKMEPKLTDRVVKESDYLMYLASVNSDSSKIELLQKEVKALKQEIIVIKTAIDTLTYEHHSHVNDFSELKNDIENVLSQLMAGDIKDMKINIKNDEPITRNNSATLFELYRQALNDCIDNNLQKAIEEFQHIIEYFPDSKLAENCRYWIAQSYFGMKDYPSAAAWFNAVINDRSYTHKDDDAAIMLGITYYNMNDSDKALVEFQRFILNYPGSEYTSKVKSWTKRLSS